jgi:hypothetical protein
MIQGQDGYHRSPLVPMGRVAMVVARVTHVYNQSREEIMLVYVGFHAMVMV